MAYHNFDITEKKNESSKPNKKISKAMVKYIGRMHDIVSGKCEK
jgi:hypothetical protein